MMFIFPILGFGAVGYNAFAIHKLEFFTAWEYYLFQQPEPC